MKKIIYILFCLIIGIICGYFWAPFIKQNDNANQILVTLFTVLAGFLVAIITIIGDPTNIPGSSWRQAENIREKIENRLIRQAWLFAIYLIVVGLIFLSSLFEKAASHSAAAALVRYINATYLGLAVFAFLLSLALPKVLMDIQRGRVDAEIEKRRSAPGAPAIGSEATSPDGNS